MAADVAATPTWRISFDRHEQLKAAIVAIAFLAVFYNVLLDLAHVWWNDFDWSHGPLIPLFSAWLIFHKHTWERVQAAPIRHNWVGLPVMLFGLALYQYSLFASLFKYSQPLSMMITLLGVIIYLCGLPVMRYAWLPWLYLFFAIPIPKRYYFALTDPLRRMAATVATAVLALVPELDITRAGSNIDYFYQGRAGQIGVVDACSGMRSTITLCALGVAVTYLSPRPLWQQLLMVGASVPIAVFCNFIRVTITCWLHIFVNPKYAEGNYHTVLGLVTLMLALGIFAGLGWVLSNLTVEERDEPVPSAGGA
ncbi:MAG: exosortase/archaeosortase family protein [Phycisphaerae bacterium]